MNKHQPRKGNTLDEKLIAYAMMASVDRVLTEIRKQLELGLDIHTILATIESASASFIEDITTGDNHYDS